MSKGSLFWGKGSGKLGETVLYRAGGEQRARVHVAKIRNPKTLAQMRNRLSMRNFAMIYRSLKPVLSQSFPNRPSKESGFNAFVKANKSVASAVITKEGALAGLCVPYDMAVSSGYLTQFGVCNRFALDGGSYVGFELNGHPNITQITTLWGDEQPDTIDTQARLRAVWNALQIPTNGVITILWATYQDDGYAARSYRITYNSTDADLASLPGSFKRVSSSTIGEPIENPALVIADTGNKEILASIIISWVDGDGKLQITNSRMTSPVVNDEFALQFVEGGDVYEQVLNGYGYNEDGVLSSSATVAPTQTPAQGDNEGGEDLTS